jgi:asparagine synthetase B (glutamine-hydrolysing)
MSMAHAQECRSPLLDYRVVEFAYNLPFSAKIGPSGKTKHLLRHLLKKHLPDSLVDKPKQGFSTPWDEWCQGAFRKKMRSAWLNQKNPWHKPEAVSMLFPKNRPGSKALQWNAFSALCFFEGGV